MNRKARLNYIHALSTQVEHKKMYKAKKQWVVAGISFLVATGMGAIGSHLTTHADTTNGNNQQTISVAPKLASGSASNVSNRKSTNNMKQSSGSAIQSSANRLHANILASANSANTNDSNTTSTVKKPLFKLGGMRLDAKAPSVTKQATSTNWIYTNNGYASSNNYNDWQNNKSDYDGFNWKYSKQANAVEFINGTMKNGTNFIHNAPDYIKNASSLKFDDNINLGNITSLNNAFSRDSNVQSIDLGNGFNTDNIFDMTNMFADDTNLINLNLGNRFNVNGTDVSGLFMSTKLSSITLPNLPQSDIDKASHKADVNYGMIGWLFCNDPNLKQITLPKYFNTRNVWQWYSIFANDDALQNITIQSPDTLLKSLDGSNALNGFYKQNTDGTYSGSQIDFSKGNNVGTFVNPINMAFNRANSDTEQIINSDISKINSLTNTNTKLSSEVSYANSVAQSDSNAVSLWKASSQAIATSLANAIIQSGSTNTQYLNSLKAKSTATSQALDRANGSLKNDSTDISNLKNELASVSSSASSASASATNNSSWIKNNSGNLNTASTEANDADSWVKAQSASLSHASTTAQSALTSASDALNSLKSVASTGSVKDLQDSYTNLSNEIYSADGLKDRISDLEKSIDSSNTSSGLSALANDYSTLSNDIYGSNSIASQVSDANNWVNNNGSTVSNEAKSASGTANANSTAISTLSNKVAHDETSIATASTCANSALGSANQAITSLGQLTTTVNGNGQAISSLQGNYSNLSSEISDENQAMVTLATTISSDETKIGSNATALSTLNTDLTNEESILSADAQNASNLASSANSLAKQNADDIKALKSNTAITLTFMNGKIQYHSPVTLTKGYIEANGSFVSSNNSKSTATYDITSLLNLNLQGYYASDYQVTIAPNASNGIANVSLKDVDGNANNGGKRLYALNENIGTELSSQLTDDKDAKKNIIHIHGVPVQYTGHITINFNTGKSDKTTVHTETIPYTINTHVDAQNINILNQANSNINNPSDYLNNITDFDTSNFKYDSANANSDGKYTISDVANNVVPTSYVYDPNTQKPATTITTINPVINFNAEATTELINYKNGSDEVGSSNESGYTDENGDVTSINDANISKKYKLVNANNNFIFTNGGSVDVPVVLTDTNPALSPENNHSNVPNKKPADMSHSIKVTINDLDSKGNQINQYPRYVTITGSKGHQFDLNPSDYVTVGYINRPNSNQDITGTVTGNGLKINTGTTWNFYAAESAGKINNPNNKTITPSTNNVPSDNHSATVPSDVNKQSDNTPVKPKAPNNPQNNDNETNTKHAIATIYIVRTRNGKNISISSKTYDMNTEPVNYQYDITPQDVKKDVNLDGYKVDSHDKDLSGIIQADGSLSNGTATFYYDVDSNQIEPMEVVYKNSDGDYISHAKADSGKDLGKDITKASEAIQPITSQELATLGTVSESVNVQQFITAPLGYYLDGSNNYNVTLQQAHKDSFGKEAAYVLTVTMPSKNNPNGEMNTQTSTVNSDVKTAQNWASNSSFSDATRRSISDDIKSMNADNSSAEQFSGEGTDGSKSAQQYFNSALSAYNNASSLATSASASVQSSVSASNSSASASVASLASLVANDVKSNQPANTGTTSLTSDEEQAIANDIDGNIKSTTSVVTNTVVDHSALDSLTNEVATNNSEINSLANKPAPTATVNYNNFDNLINNGIDKLEDTINKDFKANISNVHAQPVKPRRNIGKRTYSYLKWLRVVKPLKLYNNNHEAVKVIRPRHRITLNVKAAYKVHNHIVFKVSYRSHNYFIKANNKAIKNAYLPASHKLVGRRVRVIYNVYANKHKTSGRVKTLHKGYKSTIKHIVRIGNHNVTRIQLANGLWISANMNYVEVL